LTGASRGGSLQQAGRAAKIEQALPGFDQRRRLRMLHVEDQHAGIDVPGRGFFGNDSARDQRRIGMLLEVGGEIEFEVDNEGIGVEIDDPAVEVRVQSLVQKIDAIEGCVPGMPAAALRQRKLHTRNRSTHRRPACSTPTPRAAVRILLGRQSG